MPIVFLGRINENRKRLCKTIVAPNEKALICPKFELKI
jgi:hypothetical protein